MSNDGPSANAGEDANTINEIKTPFKERGEL
jgi:hypothetical protein